MNKYIIIILCSAFVLIQCKEDAKSEEKSLTPDQQTTVNSDKDNNSDPQSPWLKTKTNKESKSEQDKLIASKLDKLPGEEDGKSKQPVVNTGDVPQVKTLISKSKIAQLVDVDEIEITEKEVRNPQNPRKLRSCFYKWKEQGNEDAGIFIQIQSNPIPEEVHNWAELYMDSKFQSGELSYPSDGKKYRYTRLDGLGEEAAFCHELKKVIWRTNKQLIVTVADNYRVSDKKRIKVAKEIAAILNPQLSL